MTLDEARTLDCADPLAGLRDRFRIPDELIYLDGNSLGAMPAQAPERVAETVESQWGADLITSWIKHGWIDWPSALAEPLARLVGARADELLWCDSTSVNLFKLAVAAITSGERRVILTEERNFPTDQYIAQGIARLIPEVEFRRVARASLVQALDEDVALLMLTHVDYRSGERHDMARLSEAAKAAGTLCLWDLSHSAGAMRISLGECGADLAVGCGYKFLNGGPGAPAWLYVRSDLQDRLTNPVAGWMGHAEPFAFDSDYAPAGGIRKFLTGTPGVLALAALDAGLATFDGVEMDSVEAKAGALTALFIAEVEERCPGLELASPRDAGKRGAQVSLVHEDGQAVMQALIERGVIGDFRAPNLMRFGFAPLTTRYEDSWRAAEALGDVLASGEWRDARFSERRKVT